MQPRVEAGWDIDRLRADGQLAGRVICDALRTAEKVGSTGESPYRCLRDRDTSELQPDAAPTSTPA